MWKRVIVLMKRDAGSLMGLNSLGPKMHFALQTFIGLESARFFSKDTNANLENAATSCTTVENFQTLLLRTNDLSDQP